MNIGIQGADRVSIEYRLHFDGGETLSHTVHVDTHSADRQADIGDQNAPAWTRLENHQCTNCPYSGSAVSHCPAAVRLSPLIEQLSDRPSNSEVDLEVQTTERLVSTRTTLQRAMSSLFGAAIASSQCPHTRFLLPMARFHLPLSSESETVYRVASMHLLGQHLRRTQGEEVEPGMDDLADRYRQLGQVNRGLAARLRSAGKEDVSVNAVILLDLLARIVPTNIEDELEELCRWFGVPVTGCEESERDGGAVPVQQSVAG
jgi:hypothetical protein